MKKPLLIFIILALFILLGGIAYKKYCEAKPGGCKKEQFDENDTFGPEEGIDW